MDILFINENEQEEIFAKYKYTYITNLHNDWKDSIPKLNLLRELKGQEPIDLNKYESDFDLFKELYPNDTNEFMNHFFLVVDDNPVTYITTRKQEDNMYDVSIATDEKYQKLGYGTKALEMLEEYLFENEYVKGIQMYDLSQHQQTSKIANHLNYEEKDKGKWYKYNVDYIESKGR